MSELAKMTDAELLQAHEGLQKSYAEVKEQQLKLDMSRGKPCDLQLDLSLGIIDGLQQSDYRAADGTDCRNYGNVFGLPETRALLAPMLGVDPELVIVGGNSSLTMMHDLLARAMIKGLPASPNPWAKLPKVKFLCPSPGYDRHFGVTEYLGMELVTVDYKEDGPDMDQVERLVAEDDTIKGMWCVPKYSNPAGITYSDEVVRRLAAMSTKAPDFCLMWDDAYTVHHLTDTPDQLLNIIDACAEAGNPDRAFVFASTSKITFPGAGIAAVGSSKNNIAWLKQQVTVQTIGPDKINQLRHVRFFKDFDGLQAHMQLHAALLKPKFDLVQEILEQQLTGSGLATWSKPQGGYFINFDTLPGCAKKVVAKAAEAGVVLTSAGATFPYGKDPADKNIRLAPTFPPLDELKTAMELVCLCVRLVSVEQELAKRGN